MKLHNTIKQHNFTTQLSFSHNSTTQLSFSTKFYNTINIDSCPGYGTKNMYYTSGFRTETMYNYYIVMKSMFLGCKTIIPPYFWLCKLHHHPFMNYTQTIPKTIQKPKAFSKIQNFNPYKLGIHIITLYKNEGVSQGHKHLLIY